jgi:hypothetical protein
VHVDDQIGDRSDDSQHLLAIDERRMVVHHRIFIEGHSREQTLNGTCFAVSKTVLRLDGSAGASGALPGTRTVASQ